MNPKERNTVWIQGYACAIASIVKYHGHDTQTEEALAAGGISTREAAILNGVDPYDVEILWPKKNRASDMMRPPKKKRSGEATRRRAEQ
jgi:hypothetical protein